MAARATSQARSKEHHVAVGLGFLSAFKDGNLDECVGMLHPDVEWYPSPKLLETEVVRGRDEVRQYVETLRDRFGEEPQISPEDGRQVGDHVLMITLFQGRNQFTGQAVKSRECWVISVRDDQWARIVVYPNAPAARLGFEELQKAAPTAAAAPAQAATDPPSEAPSPVTIAEPMEAAATPAEQANPQAQSDAHAGAAGANTLTFTFSFEEAEALGRWLMKPSQDGALAADDAAVRPALMKIRSAVEHSQAIAEVRRELEQAGVPTQHLSDQQVAQLGRRISQAAPKLGAQAAQG